MTDMTAVRKQLALDAISKPLAHGPEGARQLARALRGIDALDNWHWNYMRILQPSSHSCGSAGCAIGYAQNFWPEQVPPGAIIEMGIVLGMSIRDSTRIFLQAKHQGRDLTNMSDVTPEMVADDLDAWADKQ